MSVFHTIPTYFLLSLLVLVTGCAVANKGPVSISPVTQVNGQGFGGGDQLDQLVKNARSEAENEVARLVRAEDSSALGDYRFCNSPFICGMLQVLVVDEAKLAFVQNYFRSSVEMGKLAEAFRTAKVVLTDKSEDTQGKQAYAANGVIKVLSSKVQQSSLDDLIALMIHEHLHLAGVYGSNLIGQMDVETFANSGGAAIVASRNKRLGVVPSTPASSAPVVVFQDDFNRVNASTLGSLWEGLAGVIGIVGNGAFSNTGPDFGVARVKSVTRRDVSIRASLDLGTTASLSFVHLEYRHASEANHYVAAIGARLNQDYDVSIYVRVNGTYRTISQNYFPYRADEMRGELRIDVVGSRHTLYYRGLQIAVVNDNTLPDAGSIAIKSHYTTVEELKVLVP